MAGGIPYCPFVEEKNWAIQITAMNSPCKVYPLIQLHHAAMLVLRGVSFYLLENTPCDVTRIKHIE